MLLGRFIYELTSFLRPTPAVHVRLHASEEAHLGEAEGIESEVTGLAAGILCKHLENSEGSEQLEESNPDKQLAHSSSLDGGVVEGGQLATAKSLHERRTKVQLSRPTERDEIVQCLCDVENRRARAFWKQIPTSTVPGNL
jgi:hypothetical protein